ncbi:MAG: cation diffusion facilitator family transporter [Chthonomonadales bacterium]
MNQLMDRKSQAAKLSVYSNSCLTLLKLIAGVTTGSISVLSEAMHSAVDLIASSIALFAVRVADLPPDEDHPYGHGKIESLSGVAEAILIFLAGAYIIFEAAHRLWNKEGPHRPDLAMVVMGISAVVNICISRHLFKVAKESESIALEADAQHLRSDVWTSLGVIVGLGLVYWTGLAWIDSAAAIAVAIFILQVSWRLTRGALDPLLDSQLPQEDIDAVREILTSDPNVLDFHKLRTRRSGSYRYIDAHVLMEDSLTLLESHDLTEALEDRLRLRLPNVMVTLHTEPYNAETVHQREVHGVDLSSH